MFLFGTSFLTFKWLSSNQLGNSSGINIGYGGNCAILGGWGDLHILAIAGAAFFRRISGDRPDSDAIEASARAHN